MKLRDLENVVFDDVKVIVSTGFNEGIEWEEVKALKDKFWGWDYTVALITKTELYDIVIKLVL